MTKMIEKLAISLVAGLALPASPGSAQNYRTPDDCYVMTGSIGIREVGMTLHIINGTENVADHTRIKNGHYYYIGQTTNIPLTPLSDAPHVKLRDPSGGIFDLVLKPGGGDSLKHPLTFYVAIGLTGYWINGGKRLAVDLGSGPIKSFAEVGIG